MNFSKILACVTGLGGLVLAVVEAPRMLPIALHWWHPEIIFSLPSQKKVIYLTIDDVPSRATDELLGVLKKHDVHATFFIIGSWAQDGAQLSKIVASGSHLGHHMWTTEACSRLSGSRFDEQFGENDRLLRKYERPVYFRPPSHFGTKEEMSYVEAHGYHPILGTVFPIDSSLTYVPLLKLMVKWLAVPGGVLVMHDGRERGFRTARVLDEVIPYLKSKGYELLPLPETPNQSLEPMARSVTRPAGAGRAPALTMAHHSTLGDENGVISARRDHDLRMRFSAKADDWWRLHAV